MPRYRVVGLRRTTARPTSRTYDAFDEDEAINLASIDGIVTERVELTAEPLATMAQVDLCTRLGIATWDGITMSEVSDLIDRHNCGGKPASPELKDIARRFRVSCTEYVGKRPLYERIFRTLNAPGREQDLAVWFAYRVAREMWHNGSPLRVSDPFDPRLQQVASALVGDVQVMRSIRKYQGSDLVSFGRWTAPDGTLYEGASNRTIAYKRCRMALNELIGDVTPFIDLPPAHPSEV